MSSNSVFLLSSGREAATKGVSIVLKTYNVDVKHKASYQSSNVKLLLSLLHKLNQIVEHICVFVWRDKSDLSAILSSHSRIVRVTGGGG